MGRLRLSLACWNCDRTRGLLEGRIPVDGITYLNLPVEETFFRMLRHLECLAAASDILTAVRLDYRAD
jgi:4,5-dihydroxyphthalate decarboxylase